MGEIIRRFSQQAQLTFSEVGHMKLKEEIDEWDVTLDEEAEDDSKPWLEQTTTEKVLTILWVFVRICIVILSLYLFVCSLSFLSAAFQILGGKSAGKAFSKGSLLTNPIVGLMMGVLVTVLVQSSSTSTSIIVAMISAGLLNVRPAVNMIMGANIGTTVTSTIVSMGQSVDRKQFRRAFAGATVHDCFNWLSVCVFLPLEYVAHPIEKLSRVIVDNVGAEKAENMDFLKKITDPFTKKIISIDKGVIAEISEACTEDGNPSYNAIVCELAEQKSLIKVVKDGQPGFLFADTGMSDTLVGVILLILSLLLLCLCLTALVKTLQSMLLGKLAKTLKKYINSDLPYPFKWLTGYLFMITGVGMTILVQSSSVFTSTLTPLVGLGVISIERMYPLTLGSNIGTTATTMLAAFAGKGNRTNNIQIALCHLFFNIFGIILFYPVPFMRRLPINGAKALGNTTAKYRWFALAYLILVFLLAPLILLGLSFNTIAFGIVFGLFVVILLIIVILNVMQRKCKDRLPKKLQTWDFLPLPMHSLKPYDVILNKLYYWCTRAKYCPCSRGQHAQVHQAQPVNKDLGLVIKNPNNNSNA